MKFTIPSGNVKTTGKVIQCLAKIGEEIYLEPSVDGLNIRTINLSRSAYAQFTLQPLFFSSIEQDDVSEGGGGENCKVMVRSLLLAFRSLSTLEKTVESCTLRTDHVNCKLHVSFKCRHNVSKEFSLGLLEYESSKPMYDMNECSNKWMILAGLMQELNGNFLPNQDEVTMTVRNDSFKLKNYIDVVDEKKQKHEVQTELSMQPGEFEMYDISQEVSVTFCLKEFRSLLTFAEYSQLPILGSFSVGGAPLILTVTQADLLTSTYVLATLADDDTPLPMSTMPPPPPVRRSTQSSASSTSLRPPISAGLLHSTQRDTSVMDSDVMSMGVTPDISNIPHVEVDLPSDRVEDPEEIAGSPPAKKKNYLFSRCFNSTWKPSDVPGHQDVLAPDSDDENIS